uniref:Olfactory receptor n=1 Tax=Erpetoichthys calabaricus TaxID=27687 RepID=A0A8C4RT30_ERPCA
MNTQVSGVTDLNTTFVRPLGFYIKGFNSLQNTHYYFIFLLFVYIATVLSNVILMSVILFVDNLHTPKYIAIFTLSVVDISCSTAIIPKCVDAFLMNSKFISYESCLAQMFFVHYFSAMESFTLVVLAYDRFISICFPLHCHTINTNTRMIIILVISWAIPLVFTVVGVHLITHLSFCKSTIINSYFCDYRPVYILACNDISANTIISTCFSFGFIFIPLIIIILSYACIIVAVMKIASAEGKWKTFKTCTAHLILVAIFYLPLLGTYLTVMSTQFIDTDVRILNTTLSATLPPLLNPIVYTLKTDEIMEQIRKLVRKRKTKSLILHFVFWLGRNSQKL